MLAPVAKLVYLLSVSRFAKLQFSGSGGSAPHVQSTTDPCQRRVHSSHFALNDFVLGWLVIRIDLLLENYGVSRLVLRPVGGPDRVDDTGASAAGPA